MLKGSEAIVTAFAQVEPGAPPGEGAEMEIL